MLESRGTPELNRTCRDVNDSFGIARSTAATLVFGGLGDPGVSNDFVHVDHVHPVPDLPNALSDLTVCSLHYDDMFYDGTPNDFYKVTGGYTGQNLDIISPGAQGGPGNGGFVAPSTGASGSIFLTTDDLSADTTRRKFDPRMLKKFVVRVRPGNSTVSTFSMALDVRDHDVAIGCYHSTVNEDLSTIDDGIYFYKSVALSGDVSWKARCTADGTTTEVDTNVSYALVGSPPTLLSAYQTLEIRLNDTVDTATFFINGALVATITENIPTAKVYGFGGTIDRTDGRFHPDAFALDRFELRCRRFVPQS